MTTLKGQAHEYPLLPRTDQLLIEGGDERIALNSQGVNKYGCSPLPDPALLAFGSSTASGVSESGYAAADRLRDRLVQGLNTMTPGDCYARELKRMRHELIELCELSALQDTSIIFAPSGTDAHFIAAQLVSAGETRPTLAIMVEHAESGSDVPSALSGELRRKAAAPAQIEIAHVATRLADGTPRPAIEVDAEFEMLANRATAAGRRTLLVLTDVSKTGLIAPSPACAIKLKQQLPGQLDVLVDASQFRIAPATLRAYLEQDFMVALTGSKFVSGPPFSGALLIPTQVAAQLHNQPFPASLAAVSFRAEWPENWNGRMLPGGANFGLLLRWEAALDELRAFRAIPDAVVSSFLKNFSLAVTEHLANSPLLRPLLVLTLDRAPLSGGNPWDEIQTIFPFLLLHPGTGEPLDMGQAREIHRLLQQDAGKHTSPNPAPRCQLGQPVASGSNDIPAGALRLCASARLAVEAHVRGEAAIIQDALTALEQTTRLTRQKISGIFP